MSKDKNTSEIERRFITHEVRAAADTDTMVVEGVASKYNVLYNMGWYLEKIDAGALENADVSECKCLFNHDPNVVLAAMSSETLSITETDGINYSAVLPDTTAAKDTYTLIKRGDVNKSSFGFIASKTRWEIIDRSELKDKVEESILDAVSYNGKVDVRTIEKIKKLYDVSPVTYPANPDTSVAKRSHDAFIQEIEVKPELVSNKRALNIADAQYMFNKNNSN